MSKPNKSRKSGLILIGGGIIIAAITMGGAYLSRHPGMIDNLFGKGGSGKDYSAFDQQITAPQSCTGLSTHAFNLLCDEISNIAAPAWDQSLSPEEQACIGPAFADYRSVMMAFHGETEEIYDDNDRNMAHYGFACDVLDMTEKTQDKYENSAGDSKELLDRYFIDWAEDVKSYR